MTNKNKTIIMDANLYYDRNINHINEDVNVAISPQSEIFAKSGERWMYFESNNNRKYITTTYEKWTEDDLNTGDTNDKGWVDEQGEDFDNVEDAIKWLKNNGPLEPSSSSFDSRVWYTHYGEMDSKRGTYTNHSYHLNGFNDEEKKQIYNAITGVSESMDNIDESNINPKYTHFAVLKKDNRIVTGWDYSKYDQIELNTFKRDYFFADIIDMGIEPKEISIYTTKTLERKGIDPFDASNWTIVENVQDSTINNVTDVELIKQFNILKRELNRRLNDLEISDNTKKLISNALKK